MCRACTVRALANADVQLLSDLARGFDNNCVRAAIVLDMSDVGRLKRKKAFPVTVPIHELWQTQVSLTRLAYLAPCQYSQVSQGEHAVEVLKCIFLQCTWLKTNKGQKILCFWTQLWGNKSAGDRAWLQSYENKGVAFNLLAEYAIIVLCCRNLSHVYEGKRSRWWRSIYYSQTLSI